MNYIYIFIAIAVLSAGVLFVSNSSKEKTPDVPKVDVTKDDLTDGDTIDSIITDTEEMDDAESDVSVKGDVVVLTNEPASVETFTVKGVNFAYDVEEIRVKEGDTVTINFESSDGYHDWVVDEFSAATDRVRPGTPTSVTFIANKAGEYEYYCSVGSHRAQGMVGKLIVE